VTKQSYIVTARGASRDYPTLVSIDGPRDADTYLKAHEAAARINLDLAQYGTDVSAFPVSETKRDRWLDLERRYNAAKDDPQVPLAEIRRLQSERRAFLKNL